MNISIIGTGYVGLVTGACLASQGFNVMCCDMDTDKIEKLKNGLLSIYEPGLSELVNNCLQRDNLSFTSSIAETVAYSDVLFITVNTPVLEDNTCDSKYIDAAADEIASQIDSYKVIVNKSTVPVGTGRRIGTLISRVLAERGVKITFDIVSNPEFLREGSAINDFLNPDRIIVGANSTSARQILRKIYSFQLEKGIPLIESNIETAEMIKYASNTFLAAKISFINEISNICELCSADALTVARGTGLDKRIGAEFLEPGPGFGGSCFPKDIKTLSGLAAALSYDPIFINSVIEVNRRQKNRMIQKIESAAGPLDNKTITVLGLSFKADTDDVRESPSEAIIRELLEKKAIIKVYDPKAMEVMKKQNPGLRIMYCDNAYDACLDSECIILATGWNEFKKLDFKKLAKLVKKPVFMDLRNIYDPLLVRSYGFYYEGVGRI